MELKKSLEDLSARVCNLKEQISTEEATKNAFVMPFIQILGYDVFNPLEVVPEFIADIGTKKGEKVDYAIQKEGVPIMIMECKHWAEKLDVHTTQLHRYFHVTKARFGILTNGVQYLFYSDLEKSNVMDEKPFFTFDLEEIKESSANELVKFHKEAFDVDEILSNAGILKWSKEIKNIFSDQVKNPSEDFVKFFAGRVYNGRLTAKVVEEFTHITKRALGQFLNELVNERLKVAFEKEAEIQNQIEEIPEESDSSGIVTTEEEMEAYYIVKSILRSQVQANRIFHRDTKSYFGVILDDNNRKPLCRLHFNGRKKYLGVFDEAKKETKHEIQGPDDLYSFAQSLLDTALHYENQEN